MNIFTRVRSHQHWIGAGLFLLMGLLAWLISHTLHVQPSFIGGFREWAGAFLAATWLFILPGWAILRLWDGAQRLTLPEQAGLAIGLGLAIYPLFLLFTDLVGLHLGPLNAWLPPLLTLPLLAWKLKHQPLSQLDGWRAQERNGNLWPNLALLIVISAVILVRCLPAHSISIPFWADSLHHTMITQLILDHGGLFTSWHPYAELKTLTYHFGFHSQAAVFTWIIGAETPRAVVLFGQIANIAAVFALYPWALRLGQTRWAGVAAIFFAGFMAAMPMYYVNWGRYTQLVGQVVMPAALYITWELLTSAERRPKMLMLLSILSLAGMVLTHYRIAIFAVAFFPAFIIVEGIRHPWRQWVGRGMLLGIGVGLVVLPWFIRLLEGYLVGIIVSIIMTTAKTAGRSQMTDQVNSIIHISFFLPLLMWYAMPISIIWAIWQRRHTINLVAFWWVFVTLAVNPQWLRLPGAGTLTNFALVIAAYIPAALLGGVVVSWLVNRLRHPILQLFILLSMVGGIWWGWDARIQNVGAESTSYVTTADIEAAKWIDAHLPADAHLLVNGYYLNEASVIGTDAGWWLPLLAHRQTTLPPLLYVSEEGPWPNYRDTVNQVYAALYTEGINAPSTMALLRERGVTHIYLGAHQGRVGYTGSLHTLDPDLLLANPALRPVYHEGAVWVFEVL
ncbi:hypothetical protein OSCT_3202 [Oscillochloris trichoides DG-6]|uniref:Glycosyltransferase RgtA/B/C/D-like domain-containing protein n=1 Tax=Oscillochloris trichoides DG-6 TaxID=765420 RepID=E1IIQ1_9CHLR|nr:hypothetical protein [Oscillochloris trichoides]EFO78957.1 hypothetical protein OSCT_3202 [Oscillochloris trichoides DG-6]